MTTIKLSNCEVDIKDSISWGDAERVKNVLFMGFKDGADKFDPSVMLESKYILLERVITEIRQGDQKVKFTREWMDNLSVEDGDKIYEAADALYKKK